MRLDNLQECPLPHLTPYLFLFLLKESLFPCHHFSDGNIQISRAGLPRSFSGVGGWGLGVEVNNLPFLSLKELILRRRIKSMLKKLLYLFPEGLALFCVDLMYF